MASYHTAVKRILLINIAHPAIGSRIPKDHLPPLGLLCIGGPLIDSGHNVSLLDAELAPLSFQQVTDFTAQQQPDIVMFGHSGSSSAHPLILELSAILKQNNPDLLIAYGGVHPSYFWQETLEQNHSIDYIVRGEGEMTVPLLVEAISSSTSLANVPGIAYRNGYGRAVATEAATMIKTWTITALVGN